MSKISTYTNAQSPISGSDKLIGTETGGLVENATKNFTVQELADFIGGGGGAIPTLQQVTDSSAITTTSVTLDGAYLTFKDGSFFKIVQGQRFGSPASGAEVYRLPDDGGTFVLRVNNIAPDNNGNVVIGDGTVFSNASMPTFADHAAAAAAITVLLGASAGSTYLYHNQATDSIGAVRL